MLALVWVRYAFLLSLSREAIKGFARYEKSIGKKRGWRSHFAGQPLLAHIITKSPHGFYKDTRNYPLGNPYSPLPSALGLALCHGGGLRVPFLFGCGITDMVDYTRPHAGTSSFFPGLISHSFPAKSRFLIRPRLLTRVSFLPAERGPPLLSSEEDCKEVAENLGSTHEHHEPDAQGRHACAGPWG